MIDTKASEKVVDAVINKGEIFEATDLVINGQPFYAVYVPVCFLRVSLPLKWKFISIRRSGTCSS